MEKHKKMRRDFYIVFIDLEKAYDNVPWEIIWRCLEYKSVPITYIRTMKDMYDKANTWVRTMGGDSKHFSVEMRLHREQHGDE